MYVLTKLKGLGGEVTCRGINYSCRIEASQKRNSQRENLNFNGRNLEENFKRVLGG